MKNYTKTYKNKLFLLLVAFGSMSVQAMQDNMSMNNNLIQESQNPVNFQEYKTFYREKFHSKSIKTVKKENIPFYKFVSRLEDIMYVFKIEAGPSIKDRGINKVVEQKVRKDLGDSIINKETLKDMEQGLRGAALAKLETEGQIIDGFYFENHLLDGKIGYKNLTISDVLQVLADYSSGSVKSFIVNTTNFLKTKIILNDKNGKESDISGLEFFKNFYEGSLEASFKKQDPIDYLDIAKQGTESLFFQKTIDKVNQLKDRYVKMKKGWFTNENDFTNRIEDKVEALTNDKVKKMEAKRWQYSETVTKNLKPVTVKRDKTRKVYGAEEYNLKHVFIKDLLETGYVVDGLYFQKAELDEEIMPNAHITLAMVLKDLAAYSPGSVQSLILDAQGFMAKQLNVITKGDQEVKRKLKMSGGELNVITKGDQEVKRKLKMSGGELLLNVLNQKASLDLSKQDQKDYTKVYPGGATSWADTEEDYEAKAGIKKYL